METSIIGQGYNLESKTSVAKELIAQFDSGRYQQFTCLVAFASFGGVSALTPYILREKRRGVKIRVVLGVDQKGTSKEALEEVLSWGVDARIYHTNSCNIFHPKVYLFENVDIFTLLVGSNNLTVPGLVHNIECSLLVKDIKSNPVHGMFYDYWKKILDGTEVNLYKITSRLIKQLYDDGVVASEHERSRRYDRGEDGCGAEGQGRSISFGTASVQRLPDGFCPKRLVMIRQKKKRMGTGHDARSVPIGDNVLIAEIGGGPRWKQVNFPVDIFENFFGAQRGDNSYNIELVNIARDGSAGDVERRQAVSVKSRNYRFEISCEETKFAYPGTSRRPIGLFVKQDIGKFLYQVLLPDYPAYNRILDYLRRESRVGRVGELRRKIVHVEAIRALYPELVV